MAYDQKTSCEIQLTADEQQILDLWMDCGLAEVLANVQDCDVLKVYLAHMPDAHMSQTLAQNLGRMFFLHFSRSLSRSAYTHLPRGCAQSFNWMMRNVNGVTVHRCLRWVLFENPTPAYFDIAYGPGHPSFADDCTQWSKVSTMLALEDFPLDISYWQEQHVTWLAHYQALAHKHGDTALIRKMRSSLLRSENRKHGIVIYRQSHWAKKLSTKSYGGKKYLELKSPERLSMLRFHLYQCGVDLS